MGKPRKRTNGAGTGIARPNGRFTAQITHPNGRRRSIGTFPTRVETEKALAVVIVEGPPPILEQSFGEYLTEWLGDLKLTLKPTTVARNRSCIARYVMGHPIAAVKVRDLEPGDFRVLYRELADHGRCDGRPLAPGSIATLDQILKAAVQRLVDDQVLRWHPIPSRVVRSSTAERPWLNLDQVRELIRFSRFRDPDLEVVIRLGPLAGHRRGEICGSAGVTWTWTLGPRPSAATAWSLTASSRNRQRRPPGAARPSHSPRTRSRRWSATGGDEPT